jgi:hypothetical protein
MVLNRLGLHHFHVATATPSNPKGRGNHLVFGQVSETEFTIVAISDHDAFKLGSPESLRFHQTCESYICREMEPGAAYMLGPVMSSGHPVDLVKFADACSLRMEQLDPLLETPDLIDQIYTDQTVERPTKPKFRWDFQDLNFGLLETRTNVFFCFYRFWDR